jgi:hypothetical protein
MNEPTGWRPSPRAQALEWWATQVVRFLVGPTVIGWELLADHGHNLAWGLVGAMITTSMDVRRLVLNLLAQAKAEQRSLQDMLDEEAERERQKAGL